MPNSGFPANIHNSENTENPITTFFNALIRETSVYKYYLELKEGAMTEKGFLDLLKVPGLRISGAGQFLKNLRLENCLSQIDVAKILNIHRSHVNNWENGYRKVPLDLLVKIVELTGISRDIVYSLIDQGKFSLKTALSVKLDKIRDIVKYFIPHKSDKGWKISVIKCSNETLSDIKNTLNVNLTSDNEIINSKELHNFLTTFFRYIRIPKIHPPLTSEVKLLHDKGVDLKRAIICPCLQTDGSTVKRNHRLKFHGYNKILHDYFVDAIYYEYKKLPTSYFIRRNYANCYDTEYLLTAKNFNELMELAGNTKTSPAVGQTVEEYLKEPQPHLDYLKTLATEQKIALRIWASTEGFVSMSRKRNGSPIYPVLGIACAHPGLIIQLKEIARRFNIEFTVLRAKRHWSGISSLYSSSTHTSIEFLKLGGFIKGVKISSSSKYHEGIDKDILTLGILEFKKSEKTNPELKNLSIKRVHDEVNKLIKNGQYYTADYYINYFSADNTKL